MNSQIVYFYAELFGIYMSLKYRMKGLMSHNRDGSFETQRARSSVLLLVASQIKEAGYKIEQPSQLKQKHISYLVNRWQDETLSPGTIKNRLAHLRWVVGKINKTVIVKSNDELGVDKRVFATQTDKSIQLDARIETIKSERIRDALRLQDAFGLRREEALKFRPNIAIKQDCISLQASWCKGRIARDIPIRTPEQRALLAEMQRKYGANSLIPPELNYKKFRDQYDNAMQSSGIGKGHGLRHGYAQARYEELTGWKCSVKGGLKRIDMDPVQRDIDTAARMQISCELGHGRIDVVAKYIGS